MTNYEKIKAMSVEEMAEFLALDNSCCSCTYFDDETAENCKRCIHKEQFKSWLKKEVEENMLPEICSCGYRFENDETICPNCGKKVEEDG